MFAFYRAATHRQHSDPVGLSEYNPGATAAAMRSSIDLLIASRPSNPGFRTRVEGAVAHAQSKLIALDEPELAHALSLRS